MRGEIIRRARKLTGLSWKELAARLGCSSWAVARWERGECTPLQIFRDRLKQVLLEDFALIYHPEFRKELEEALDDAEDSRLTNIQMVRETRKGAGH